LELVRGARKEATKLLEILEKEQEYVGKIVEKLDRYKVGKESAGFPHPQAYLMRELARLALRALRTAEKYLKKLRASLRKNRKPDIFSWKSYEHNMRIARLAMSEVETLYEAIKHGSGGSR